MPACISKLCAVCALPLAPGEEAQGNPTIHHRCTVTVQCAWCGRHQVAGQWIDVALNALLPKQPISHGICLTCAKGMLKETQP